MPETFFGWVVYLLQQYGSVLLKGAVVTLLLAVVGTFIGCIIGLIVGVIQTIPLEDNDSKVKRTLVRCLQRLLDAYVEVFRGTPMIVQAMVVYYGAMSLFDIDMSPLFAGFLVVSINTGAYMAETVRGGIESVDPGQKEAAIAIGMDHIQTMRCVILPGSAQRYAAAGQQPDYQYQGYLCIERYLRNRAVLCFQICCRCILQIL